MALDLDFQPDEPSQGITFEPDPVEALPPPSKPASSRYDRGALGYARDAFKRGLKTAEQAEIVTGLRKGTTEDIARTVKEQEALPSSPAYQKFNEAKGWKESIGVFIRDPVEITSQIVAESLGAMLPVAAKKVPAHVATGMAAGAGAALAIGAAGPQVAAPEELITVPVGTMIGARAGLATGMGATSLTLEYSGKILDVLRESGVDLKDPASLEKAFKDKELMGRASALANRKGVPIAIFDAFSAGIAGKLVTQPAKTVMGKVGQGAAELAVQSSLGMAGEMAGQDVAGEQRNVPAILAEGVGELGPGAVEVGAGAGARTLQNRASRYAPPKSPTRLSRFEEAYTGYTEVPPPPVPPQRFTRRVEEPPRTVPPQPKEPDAKEEEETKAPEPVLEPEVLPEVPNSIIVQTPNGPRRATISAGYEDMDPSKGARISFIKLHDDATGSYEMFPVPAHKPFKTLDEAGAAGFELVRGAFKEIKPVQEPEAVSQVAFRDLQTGEVIAIPGRIHAQGMFPEVAKSAGTTPERLMEMEPGFMTNRGRYVTRAEADSLRPPEAPTPPVEAPVRPVGASLPPEPAQIPPEAPKAVPEAPVVQDDTGRMSPEQVGQVSNLSDAVSLAFVEATLEQVQTGLEAVRTAEYAKFTTPAEAVQKRYLQLALKASMPQYGPFADLKEAKRLLTVVEKFEGPAQTPPIRPVTSVAPPVSAPAPEGTTTVAPVLAKPLAKEPEKLTSTEAPKRKGKASRYDSPSEKNAAARAQQAKTKQAQASKKAEETKDALIVEIQQALSKVPSEPKEGDKVTIKSGTSQFTVANTVEAISELLSRVQKLKTDSVKPQSKLVPASAVKSSQKGLDKQEAQKQGKAFRDIAAELAARLEALKIDRSKMLLDPTIFGGTLWNEAVNLAQLTIRAGGTVADAVQRAVEFIQQRFTGQWDEAEARRALTNEAEQEEALRDLAVETGEAPPPVPTPAPEGKPTVQVHGATVEVKSKRLLSADAGRQFALDQFRKAGLDVEIGPDNRVKLKDETTPGQNAAGRRLLELTRNVRTAIFEMAQAGSPDNDSGANFLDSVRMLAVRMLSEQRDGRPTAIDDVSLLNDLFQAGHQGIRQWGQALQAVGVRGKEFEVRMRYVDAELQGWLSERFGGEPDPDSVPEGTPRREGAGDIVRDVIKEVEKETKATPKDPKGAAQRGLATVQGKLTEEQKGYAGPKTVLWKTLEKAVLDGERDDYKILRKIAAKFGANPSDADIQKMKALVKRLDALRKLTPKQLEKLAKEGITPETIQRYDETGEGLTNDQEQALTDARSGLRANKATIDRLHADMVSLWAKITKPIGWRSVEVRRNFIRAMNEFAPINVLFRLAFAPVQGIDILTQGIFGHNLTASLAQATRRLANLDEKGVIPWTKEFAKALGDGVMFELKATRAGWNAFKLGMLKGKGLNLQTEGIDTHMHIMERLVMAAQENMAKGDPASIAKAVAQYAVSRIGLGLQFAKSLDAFQQSTQRLPELVGMVKTWLINNTDMTRAEVAIYADEIVGDIKDELAYARMMAPEILQANGVKPTNTELTVAAWNVVFGRILDRARESKIGPAATAQMEDEILHRMQTLGWNLPERSWVGSLTARPLKNIEEALVKAYIPSGPLTMFGNAIATSIVQGLQWMGAGLRPEFFQGSPTVRSALDRTQTKWKGAVGLSLGLPLTYAIATGLFPYWRKWPDDDEEKAKMEALGLRPGTIYIPIGGDQYFGISVTTGPLGLLRTFAATGAGVRDMALKHDKAQQRLNEEAARLGVAPGIAPGWTSRELLGVVMGTAWDALQGSRVASGKVGQFTDYGQLVGNKAIASYVSAFIPSAPMYQNLAGIAGIELNPRLASVGQLILPTTDGPRRTNVFGEPATEIGDVQNIVNRLTRGSGSVVDMTAKDMPYASLFASGYMPPAISPNKGYNFNGTFRPMNGSEYENYAQVRGQEFYRELESLGFSSDPDAIGKAYRTANRRALGMVGVSFPRPKRPRRVRGRKLRAPRLSYRRTSTSLRRRRASRY